MAAHQQWLVPYIFDKPQFEKPIFSAKKCECGGDLEIKIIEGPTSILEFAICNRCKSRERIK